MTIEHPRILFVDSYDSFTFNLASLCRRSIPNCSIYIIKNDDLTITQLIPYLSLFSAIIVGPGPGSPDNPHDIGIVKDLWKVPGAHLLPVFGVCLGLQSLALEHGAELCRLKVVKHGQVSAIHHTGEDIFAGVESVHAVRYHSLHVKLCEDGEIEQLGWADDGEENGKVVMGVKHKSKPFWAVQYHPESVCTDGGGYDVLCNFWRLAQEWSRKVGRVPAPWKPSVRQFVGPSWPNVNPHSAPPSPTQRPAVTTKVLKLGVVSITRFCEILGVDDENKRFALLDSAAKPGRYSIIASLMPTSPQITYYVGDSWLTMSTESRSVRHDLTHHTIWAWLASFIRRRRAHGGSPDIPFWGGLIGYLSYELGVNSLNVSLKTSERRHPDVNMVFVERSIVYDNQTGQTHIQSLLPDDQDWIADIARQLGLASQDVEPHSPTMISTAKSVVLPDKSLYISRINQAKDSLFSGDSYELCLTAPTRITIPASSSPTSTSWQRYKQLRKNNPAPHSAYLRLHPSTLLSSSPERFLSYSRPPGTVCQLRPIKGTVRKSPTITRAIAEKALAGSKKEVAENLMIVDLIRHDLHSVVGEDVAVTQFCKVEEYETVWQLVSVIEGRLPEGSSGDVDLAAELGWDVLSKSLPPGSMTGAPKKRSVEILQNLEDDPRSIYSGVFGYWCVSGAGDWSVTIRSCFKFQDMQTPPPSGDASTPEGCRDEEWQVGAGGAITALSDADDEWEEMVIKLHSVLKSFGIKE
ncbi:Protein phosphatase PP2A regulatory subunit B [Pleurotus pulmonarius]|nr:Protein phosphatase PP2A regulatory subunit B [Pleurotus pulmonarius]KAF4606420.1 Protein phosphatase PP2A regulatory subunit B [Pleurotus pulmonarius]